MKEINQIQGLLNRIQGLSNEGVIFHTSDIKSLEIIVEQIESFISDLKTFKQVKL